MKKYSNRLKKILMFIVVLTVTICNVNIVTQAATKKNISNITLSVGNTTTLKVAGKKGVKWISSDKKVATVSQKGVVKAKSVGYAKITAKSGGKNFTWNLTVKANINKSLTTLKNYVKQKGKTIEDYDTVVNDYFTSGVSKEKHKACVLWENYIYSPTDSNATYKELVDSFSLSRVSYWGELFVAYKRIANFSNGERSINCAYISLDDPQNKQEFTYNFTKYNKDGTVKQSYYASSTIARDKIDGDSSKYVKSNEKKNNMSNYDSDNEWKNACRFSDNLYNWLGHYIKNCTTTKLLLSDFGFSNVKNNGYKYGFATDIEYTSVNSEEYVEPINDKIWTKTELKDLQKRVQGSFDIIHDAMYKDQDITKDYNWTTPEFLADRKKDVARVIEYLNDIVSYMSTKERLMNSSGESIEDGIKEAISEYTELLYRESSTGFKNKCEYASYHLLNVDLDLSDLIYYR